MWCIQDWFYHEIKSKLLDELLLELGLNYITLNTLTKYKEYYDELGFRIDKFIDNNYDIGTVFALLLRLDDFDTEENKDGVREMFEIFGTWINETVLQVFMQINDVSSKHVQEIDTLQESIFSKSKISNSHKNQSLNGVMMMKIKVHQKT